ncbi:GNAT family N-acetyltransferase [Marinomonas posidonica]|uniref:GCN5-related N-acetyltransferase n=1 Tax=Marinomonas posidonica (strain CECT 7376 / NCIMB 14433 / IVIA-Po-181) TaxID=491952 RepID=F6CTU0_MARPP|nr:GNAT family N-acetyltransferase [Marinomonas posidonica]AEF56309.1 GCN5-related N-acetyltransferase [Marinomonas posidonica IVIA-Po-181]
MPFENFCSERLDIFRFPAETPELLSAIIDVLSGDATEYLPEEWANIDSQSKADTWLKQRLSEGDLFLVSKKACNTFVGLLLIYGFEQGKKDQDVRIGYVISDEFWGKGFASELIKALISKLSKIEGVSSVIGGVVPSNIGSVKVLTKNGFHFLESLNGTAFYQRKC